MTTPTARTQARLDKVLDTVRDPRFLGRKGQSNELSFFVFDHPPEDELLVRSHVDYVMRQLQDDPKVRPICIDLYDEVLGVLADRGVLDKVEAMESKEGFAAVLNKLQRGVLKPDNLVQRIQRKVTPDHNLMLLTGAGTAFPYLRSHTVLNNLHHPLGDMTVILFFPGVYDQKELRLFGRLKDDNYYRAFRLVGDM